MAGVSHQEGGSGETEESKMEWKPIETVPTDTPILITDGKIVTVTVLNVTVLNKCGDDPKWMHGHGFSGYEWQYDFMINQATHWMPLPQPPVVE